jgi:ubiquinone/menaquinone biosynthesis C-methylase UbiE
MALTETLSDVASRLGKSAELSQCGAMRELAQCVSGCDYGSTGNTTREEAEHVARLLGLRPGMRLLDVGAGAGWPGLYLAGLSGCELALVDLPLEPLRIARARAAADGMAQRCVVAVADGAALPFADASFDALSHSDLLCCTPNKLGVLRACRRVARAGVPMVFSTIVLAPGLSEARRQAAMLGAPSFVASDADYAELLAQSGWRLRQRSGVTSEFLRVMRSEHGGMQDRAEALARELGAEVFAQRMARLRAGIAAIEAGLLLRELFVATAD